MGFQAMRERVDAQTVSADPLFQGLARPPMFAGVPAGYFVVVAVLVGEGVFIFKHWLVGVVGLLAYGFGLIVTVRDANAFQVLAVRWLRCPPTRGAASWRAESRSP
jgi:type IV secretory pathway VirB3-like protein